MNEYLVAAIVAWIVLVVLIGQAIGELRKQNDLLEGLNIGIHSIDTMVGRLVILASVKSGNDPPPSNDPDSSVCGVYPPPQFTRYFSSLVSEEIGPFPIIPENPPRE